MQGISGTPTVTPSQQDIQDITTGQDLYTKFQQKQISCTQLQDGDFEKIGEYLMNQRFGNDVNAHIQMNDRMKQMMGDQAEERMHIALARSATGCTTGFQQGGGRNMMGMGYGYQGMMGGGWYGFEALWLFGYAVIMTDLILVGIWLWKQIKKK